MRFFGGKNLAGVYQRIINQIPPHRLYIEPFAGSAAILRHKLPAARSIAIDLDPGALDAIRDAVPRGTELLNEDGITWLKKLLKQQQARRLPGMAMEIFVYCDPPYLPETRSSGKRYRHELTRAQHKELLGLLTSLACPVMLSGYRSDLYDRGLWYWRRIEFPAITRGGWKARECLWMNYPKPVELHDYRHLGRDFREREKLVRQQRRWIARLGRMDRLQRQALLAAIAIADCIDGARAGPDLPAASIAVDGEMAGHTLISAGAVPTAVSADAIPSALCGGPRRPARTARAAAGRKSDARGNHRKGR